MKNEIDERTGAGSESVSLEPNMFLAFVLRGPSEDIGRMAKAFQEVMDAQSSVRAVYTRTSMGMLWIADEKPGR